MPVPRCRPFTVMDGMILVAAVALTLWLVKVSDEYNGSLFSRGRFDNPHDLTDESDIPYLSALCDMVRKGAAPLLLPASFALLITRLRSPRPALRRLARQPGFAATSAVALIVSIDFAGRVVANVPAFVIHAQTAFFGFVPRNMGPRISYIHHIIIYLKQGLIWFLYWYQVSLWNIHSMLGAAVAAVWTIMALGRTWRRESGWIDRCGIALGSVWLVVLLAYCVSYDWR